MIHCCDKCCRPILIYGRMIPCKHVFCLGCARSNSADKGGGNCSRCGDRVARVEQAGLGSIYMCSHGGSRYGNNGCRRTYLSQRDLQAHIHHRHMKNAAQSSASGGTLAAIPSAAAINEATAALLSARSKTRPAVDVPASTTALRASQQPQQQPIAAAAVSGSSHISVLGSGGRTSNLIPVPMQEPKGGFYAGGGGSHQTGSGGYAGQFSQPPPNYFPGGGSGAPPPHRQQQHFEGSPGGHQGWRTSGSALQGPARGGYYRQ